MEMLLDVRFGYGAESPWISKTDRGMRFTAGPDSMSLSTPGALETKNGRVAAYPVVRQGDRLPFQLTWHPSHEAAPNALDVAQALSRTEAYWKDWASRCSYRGEYSDAVMRSLLTLKGLIYEPTGGIVAALTTSLPEELGGVRNWDYRFCWLRDASLTLDALMIGGYTEETRAFRDWLLRAVAGDPVNMQIMYSLAGVRRLTEYELDWMPGYEGSRPVRVGNAASGQFQLDVYGEVLSCLYEGRKRGLAAHREGWRTLLEILSFLEGAWQRPDDGIWEVR